MSRPLLLSRPMRASSVLLHALLLAGLGWRVGLGPGLLWLLPLLAPLPGLVVGRLYTYRWASMLIAFYVAGLLAEAYMWRGERLLFLVLASVAALEFATIVLYARFVARERAAGLHGDPAPGAGR